MPGPIAVDTPDYQRGVVNAQKLLEYVFPPAASATVGVPPNAETLIIVYPVGLPYQGVSVLGASTGIPYPTVINSETNNSLPGNTAWCDVSAAVDSEVTITINGWTGDSWWVYADSGVHVMVDAANTRDGWGRLQVVSTIPGNQPFTHPLEEIQHVGGAIAVSTVALAAPGAGIRYRLYGINLMVNAGANFGVVGDVPGGTAYAWCAPSSSIYVPMHAQGFPTATNSQVEVFFDPAAAGTIGYVIYYSIETV